MKQTRLNGLDMLRGIAALAVVLLHIDIAYPGVGLPFTKAYLAVDFFFMLSGFVLTRTYQSRFFAGLGVRAFLRLRLKRLWPTIAIAAMLGAVATAEIYSFPQLMLFVGSNLALIPMLGGGVTFPLNGPVWSIQFELLANIVHAGALAQVRRRVLGALIIATAIAMIMIAVALDAQGAGPWDVGGRAGNILAGLPRVILSYTLGCLLYRHCGDRPVPGVPPWAAPVMLPTSLLLGDVMGGGWVFDAVFVLLVSPVILLAGLSSCRQESRLARIAGDLSFPLYAVHMPMLLIATKMGWPWIAGLVIAVPAAALTLFITRAPWRFWLGAGFGGRSARVA